MKTYRYVTLNDDDIQPKYYTFTEQQILSGYDRWAMLNKNVLKDTSKEAFIQQWIDMHCAWEINNG